MPGKGTTRRTIRVDADLWTRAGEQAVEGGTDRATVIKEFLRWYVGEPDAELPGREGRAE
jgi:Arc/MetJ family transcription regulator